jgi:peptidyl-prolyl cis-trans isomerase SurA
MQTTHPSDRLRHWASGFLAFLMLLLLFPASIPAQEVRIAAVVNDDVISMADVESRTQLIIASANIEDTKEQRQRLIPQVLRSLIDEKLELQEAKRLNIKVTDQEVQDAFGRIEDQNHLARGGLDAFLKTRGIDRASLADQATASIAWSKVVHQRAFEVSPVSDDEVDEALARIRSSVSQPQNRVAEIFMTVDNPQQDEEVRRAAERLFDQLQAGASFPSLARQFSQSATAAIGGDLGWATATELPADVARIVETMKPGQVSPPTRIGGGYYILWLIDRRAPGFGEPELSLAQIMLPLAAGGTEAERQAAITRAEGIRKEAKSCGEFLKIGSVVAPKTSGDLGRIRLGELPADLRSVVSGLKAAEISVPVPLRGGIGLLMVCSRREGSGAMPSRDEVAETLARQRLDGFAQRYLRDLRRAAFLDVRA